MSVLLAGILSGAALLGCRDPASVGLDLDGGPVDPLRRSGETATVLLFVSVECPISNRYAPEIQRLARRFAGQGVRFWLVYPDPDDSRSAVEAHLADYGHALAPLRDPLHHLVRRAGVTVTPAAAVFDAEGRLAYRGRIDDRYVAFGRRRQSATQRDLESALEAVVLGRRPPVPRTTAVGCYIRDFE